MVPKRPYRIEVFPISNFDTSLADLRGGGRPARAPPPYGSRFFRFDMQNFRNVAASGVHGPPYEVHAPLREILDPPLYLICLSSLISPIFLPNLPNAANHPSALFTFYLGKLYIYIWYILTCISDV